MAETEVTILASKRDKFDRVAQALTTHAGQSGNANQIDLGNMISVANRGAYSATQTLWAMEEMAGTSRLLPEQVARAIDHHLEALDRLRSGKGNVDRYLRHERALTSILEEHRTT